MSKYKHAMEIIENWERVESLKGSGAWTSPSTSNPGKWNLDDLNDPRQFRIKREPRRVWVNMDRSGEPGNVWNSIEEAKRRKDESWCSESAVEFVEVIK